MDSIGWAINKLNKLHPTAYGFRTMMCGKCHCGLMVSYLIPDQEDQYDNGFEKCYYFCPSCLNERTGLRVIKSEVSDKTN